MVGDDLNALMARIGAPALAPETGIRALRQILDRGESGLVVADFDWSRFTPAFTLTRPSPLLAALPEAAEALAGPASAGGEAEAWTARMTALAPAAREAALLDLVRTAVAEVQGHDGAAAVDPARGFEDLGFDSVAAVELGKRLSQATGRKLPSTLTFDHTSPAALAAFLGTLFDDTESAPVPALLAAVSRFDTALPGLAPDDLADTGLLARLRALLAAVEAAADPGPATDGADTRDLLAAASADDVFAFIDAELGSA